MLDDSEESHVIRTVLGIAQGAPRDRADPHQPGHDGVLVGDRSVLDGDSGGEEIVTVDTLVEGVHFDDRLDASDVGWKAVAVNASDVGAMGGSPTWALLSLALPRPLDRAWVDAFGKGLREGLGAWSARLVGGDTVRSVGPVMVSLTLAGRPRGEVPGRGGALEGDDLWVTGRLGRASAGFHGIGDTDWLRRPRPPVHLGGALVEHGLVHAMMDVSDGLATDLPRLCAASDVGAAIEPNSVPIAGALVGRNDALDHALAFGDDYELLFAASPDRSEDIEGLARAHQTEVTRIGRVTRERDVVLLGRAWPTPRFAHFGATT